MVARLDRVELPGRGVRTEQLGDDGLVPVLLSIAQEGLQVTDLPVVVEEMRADLRFAMARAMDRTVRGLSRNARAV